MNEFAHQLKGSALNDRQQIPLAVWMRNVDIDQDGEGNRTRWTVIEIGPVLVFGPVLLHLYINDMYRSSNQLRFVHFVDDTTVFASDSDINNVHATVIRELVGVDNWLKTNKPSLNVGKTSYMIISTQKKSIHYYNSIFNPYEGFNCQI